MKNFIKLERVRNNLTQADLAEKVKVSRQTIIAVESGRFIPSALLAFKIAKVLQCKMEVLFDLEDRDWD